MSFFKGIAAVAALALVLVSGTSAGEAPSSLQSGIGVRGSWVVDVIESDGQLASHSEFQNHLADMGANALTALLAGEERVQAWALDLYPPVPAGSSPCSPSYCQVREPLFGNALGSDNLVVTPADYGSLLELSGSVEADQDGSIERVESLIGTLEAFVLNGADTYRFTTTHLPEPVTVTAGQIIQVHVEFTFGTLS